MQIKRFTTGGYVCHKLPIGSARRASAWFGADGALIDAERFDRRGRACSVRKGSPMWQTIARRWGNLQN